MRIFVFVLTIFLLLGSAATLLARDIGDGGPAPYPAPATATRWPTITPEPYPAPATDTPRPPERDEPGPTRTPPPQPTLKELGNLLPTRTPANG